MIVIKINEVPNSKEGLKERTRRAWKINQDRLYNQETLISVYKGEILEEYKVLGYGPDKSEPNRVAFELEEVSTSNLKGKRINYRTSNPCTIVDPLKLGINQSIMGPVVKKHYIVDPNLTNRQLNIDKGIGDSLDEREREALGFTEEDIEAIWLHFTCRPDLEDWKSMRLFENDDAIFKYLFIEDEDKESITETLLEMARMPVDDLKDGKSLMEYMIEDGESRYKLPSGKWVIFTDELLRKDVMAQID